jgi:1,4-alpha-glucan branching enzyme
VGYQLVGYFAPTSFWQSTRIYGASRPIASSRNWRYSRLGTFPLPDDAHGLGFFDGSNLLNPDRKKRISSRLEKLGV